MTKLQTECLRSGDLIKIGICKEEIGVFEGVVDEAEIVDYVPLQDLWVSQESHVRGQGRRDIHNAIDAVRAQCAEAVQHSEALIHSYQHTVYSEILSNLIVHGLCSIYEHVLTRQAIIHGGASGSEV